MTESAASLLGRLVDGNAGAEWDQVAASHGLVGEFSLFRADPDGNGTWSEWMIEGGGRSWMYLPSGSHARRQWLEIHMPPPEFVKRVATFAVPDSE